MTQTLQGTEFKPLLEEDDDAQPIAAIVNPLAFAAPLALGNPAELNVLAATAKWHLSGTWGLHTDKVWNDYTGNGILVAVMDDGFQYTHTDLSGNYRTDIDLDMLGNDDNPMITSANRHGTSVTGIIAADDNGTGTVGVAFDSKVFGLRMGYGAETDLAHIVKGFQHALVKNADVINNSWGLSQAFSDDNGLEFYGTDFYQIHDAMKDFADGSRGGLGGNIVFSAGNARASGENVNYHNIQNSPYSITVASIDSNGIYSSFSNPGAALLVSAGGSNIWTTDVSGTGGYASGDYTYFSGTSASAPVVSGLVALILDANPYLGWRDVQEIIAYSAQHNDSGSASWQYNGAGNWNGGGLHFSHNYGFGAADAHAAVRLAESWTVQQTSSNMITTATFNAAPALAIPSSGTITTTLNVGTDIEIEHVLIDLDIAHGKAGELIVTLISPDGTESVLASRINNGTYTVSPYGYAGIDFQMSSNAHWGESSVGTWTLKIQDFVSGYAGTLKNWGLTFLGNSQSADDVYFYTDAFGTLSAAEYAARCTLTDTGGVDTLNLSTLTSNAHMNIVSGTGSSVIAGNNLNIAAGTLIENVYLGDGNDDIITNDANNRIYGGRGNDTIVNSLGDDIFDGQQGTDTACLIGVAADYVFNYVSPSRVITTHAIYGTDTWDNFEGFSYSDGNSSPITTQIQELRFSWSTKFYLTEMSGDESRLLKASAIGYSTTTANIIELIRAEEVITVNYLSTYAPKNLQMTGSSGNETLIFKGILAGVTLNVSAGEGDDTITLLAAPYFSILRGGNGVDLITGYSGRDTIHGDDGNDILNGAANYDILSGGAGNDTLLGGTGLDTLHGGDDSDLLNGENDADKLNGDAGDDTLNGGSGNDIASGGDGDDLINGDDGYDTLNGNYGNDTINGGRGLDRIYGGAGNDTLSGDYDADLVYGDSGEDTIFGGQGIDKLYGGTENDTLYGDTEVDFLYGDAGNDWLNGGAGADRLYGGDGDDTLFGELDNDLLYGNAGDDRLLGGTGANRLYGGTGNDTLEGGAANDALYGEDGSDLLIGGSGTDSLYGGAGIDSFAFITISDGIDIVRDFSAGEKLNITDLLTGFDIGIDNIDLFVRMSGTTAKTFQINSDGAESDFVTAFTVYGTGLAGHTVSSLFGSGQLIVDQTIL